MISDKDIAKIEKVTLFCRTQYRVLDPLFWIVIVSDASDVIWHSVLRTVRGKHGHWESDGSWSCYQGNRIHPETGSGAQDNSRTLQSIISGHHADRPQTQVTTSAAFMLSFI